MSDAYRDAGVDIDAGERVVQDIKQHVQRTRRPEVMGSLGGFGALCSCLRATKILFWSVEPMGWEPSFLLLRR